MKKTLLFLCLTLSTLFSSEKESFCYFAPPSDWECADPKALSSLVQIGFVGKGKKLFRPSLNLAIEEIDCDMKEYLKAVKEIHESDPHTRWRDMGAFHTKAGEARLTEISRKTKWGDVRMLQSILIHQNRAYILTGAVLRDEFSEQYKMLLNAMRSMQVTDDLISDVENQDLREKLKKACISLKNEKDTHKFQDFQKLVLDEYKDMGMHWQILMVKYAAEHYLNSEIVDSNEP